MKLSLSGNRPFENDKVHAATKMRRAIFLQGLIIVEIFVVSGAHLFLCLNISCVYSHCVIISFYERRGTENCCCFFFFCLQVPVATLGAQVKPEGK